MADNVTFQSVVLATPPDLTVVSTEEITTLNGGAVAAQHVERILLALRTGNGIAIDLTGDQTFGLDVDVTRIPLPTDAATQTTLAAILAKLIAAPSTEAKQDTGNTSLASILAKIIAAPATEAKQDTGNTSLASILAKIIAAPATEAKQDTAITSLAAILTTEGATTDAAVSTDANGSVNAHIRGVIVNLIALLARLPAALGQGTMAQSLRVVLPSDQSAVPVSLSSAPLPTGAATETTLAAVLAKLIAAPATEATVATLLTLAGFQARINTLGQKTMANSTPMVLASDQAAIPVTESGTWTVQPGNTQNTTPWLVSPLMTAIDVTLTRPNDTATYAANDEMSSSTSAPAVNTITSAARASGGMVRLRAASCVDSSNVAAKPQLLVYIFDTTTTPNNDNAAFAPADSVLNTCVGVLPFNIWYPGDDTAGATGNAFSPYLGPEIDIKTVGSANLFFRVKVLNAYVPTALEAFVFRFDFVQY